MFDTGDFSEDNPYNILKANSKVMKDENNGTIMIEFVGLRSKMYGIRLKGRNTIKKAKGVKGYVVSKNIDFYDYIHCLTACSTLIRSQNTIPSKLHQVYTQKQTKIALTPMIKDI